MFELFIGIVIAFAIPSILVFGIIYGIYSIKNKDKRQIEKQAEEQKDWLKLHYIKTKEFYKEFNVFMGFTIFVFGVFVVFMWLISYAYIKDIKPVFDYINHTIEIENSEENK